MFEGCSESGEVGDLGLGDGGSSRIQDRTLCEDVRKEQAVTMMGFIQSLPMYYSDWLLFLFSLIIYPVKRTYNPIWTREMQFDTQPELI